MQRHRLSRTTLRNSTLAWLMMFFAAAAWTGNVNPTAAGSDCRRPNVVVLGGDPGDRQLACEGAGAALGFLEGIGLDVSGKIEIEIVSSLDGNTSGTAAGCYLAGSHKVMVLNYQKFLAFGDWFGIPIDHALYRSLVAHEAAHVVAACHFQYPNPTIQAQEYIAYVTMFATMEPRQRASVMMRYPGKGYETEQQINATIYLCDPMRFGVQVYRHFLKDGHGADYLRAVLAGSVLAQ
jgi:hypothetical protein